MERDVDFLLEVLSDGEEHELSAIMARSFAERGCGLTVHSRAADLRRRGYLVVNRTERQAGTRRTSFYRLAGLDETPAERPLMADAGVSSGPDEPNPGPSVLADAPPRWAA